MNRRFLVPGLLIFAVIFAARCAVAQVSTTIAVVKAQDFKQTGTAAPAQVTNPFTLTASVQAQGYTITSATVTPPGGSAINLASQSTTLFSFTSNPFATAAALNGAFPTGNYTFSVQPPTGTGIVTMPADNYPPAPALNNPSTQWTAGALQFNPTASFTIGWQTGAAPTEISLTVTDVNGAVVFNTSVSNTATAQSIPANTLQGGNFYSARLTFGRTTTTAGTVVPRATFQTVTNFTLNPVNGSPGLVTPTGFTIIVGQPVAYQLVANTNATFTLDSTLPAGLTFDPATGIVFGTPTASGSPSPAYTVTNASGTNGGILNVTSQSPPAGPSFVNATSATGHVGVPFTFQIVTKGASPAAQFSATGLPRGLAINSATGLISGTVLGFVSAAATVTVNDGSFTRSSSLQLTFVSDPILPVITSARRVTLVPGRAFSYQITAAYGTNRVDEPSFKILGALPSGLSFDPKTGVLSGTFTGAPIHNSDPPEVHALNDTPPVQLVGTNTHGSGTSPLAFFTAPSGTVNLSTRMFVGTDQEVLIGGFIITGNAAENVVLRGIGPSLPLSTALQDPVLELHDKTGAIVTTNDDWRATQEQAIKDAGVPPADNRESAIVATFQPSNFTAIVTGKNSTTGIGLVELFDLGTQTQDTSARGRLAQISTRGTVHTGDDVMIGGFIIQAVATKTLLRGIGPELTAQSVAGALQDTVLELHDSTGTLVDSNDNWVDSANKQAIVDTTVAPKDDRESAILATLNPGSYTAVLRGKNNTTGVALVEVYNLQ